MIDLVEAIILITGILAFLYPMYVVVRAILPLKPFDHRRVGARASVSITLGVLLLITGMLIEARQAPNFVVIASAIGGAALTALATYSLIWAFSYRFARMAAERAEDQRETSINQAAEQPEGG